MFVFPQAWRVEEEGSSGNDRCFSLQIWCHSSWRRDSFHLEAFFRQEWARCHPSSLFFNLYFTPSLQCFFFFFFSSRSCRNVHERWGTTRSSCDQKRTEEIPDPSLQFKLPVLKLRLSPCRGHDIMELQLWGLCASLSWCQFWWYVGPWQ